MAIDVTTTVTASHSISHYGTQKFTERKTSKISGYKSSLFKFQIQNLRRHDQTGEFNLVSEVFVLVTMRLPHIYVFHSVKKVMQVAGPLSICKTYYKIFKTVRAFSLVER